MAIRTLDRPTASGDSPEDLIPTQEAAEALGVDVATIRRWLAQGILNGARRGRDNNARWQLPRSEVDRVLALQALEEAQVASLPPFVTPMEACARIGVSERTLRRWLTEGRLLATKRGSRPADRWLIPEAEVERIRAGGKLRDPETLSA